MPVEPRYKYEPLSRWIKEALGHKVGKVVMSMAGSNLPCALATASSSEGGPAVNPDHSTIVELKRLVDSGADSRAVDLMLLLFETAQQIDISTNTSTMAWFSHVLSLIDSPICFAKRWTTMQMSSW